MRLFCCEQDSHSTLRSVSEQAAALEALQLRVKTLQILLVKNESGYKAERTGVC